MRMEHEIKDALFSDGDIEQGFPVGNGLRVVALVEVLRLPIAGDRAGKFPAEIADDVRIGIVIDGGGVSGERQILAELFAAVRVEDEFARESRVVGGGDVEDGGIQLQEMVIACRRVKNLGEEARAEAVDGVATRHAKGDRAGIRDLAQEIDATVDRFRSSIEIFAGEQWAGMAKSVNFNGEAFGEPGLQLRIRGIDFAGHDAHGSAAIDLFEPVQDGAQESLVFFGVLHVIDSEDDNGVNAGFADPLRGD